MPNGDDHWSEEELKDYKLRERRGKNHDYLIETKNFTEELNERMEKMVDLIANLKEENENLEEKNKALKITIREMKKA